MQYLKVTSTIKITYSTEKREELIIKIYFNFDWASDYNIKKSISKFIFILNGGLVSKYFKKKAIIALSSIEVKYMVLTFAA